MSKILETISGLSDDVERLEKELAVARTKRARAMKKARDERFTFPVIAAAARITHEAVRKSVLRAEPEAKAKAAADRRALRSAAK